MRVNIKSLRFDPAFCVGETAEGRLHGIRGIIEISFDRIIECFDGISPILGCIEIVNAIKHIDHYKLSRSIELGFEPEFYAFVSRDVLIHYFDPTVVHDLGLNPLLDVIPFGELYSVSQNILEVGLDAAREMGTSFFNDVLAVTSTSE